MKIKSLILGLSVFCLIALRAPAVIITVGNTNTVAGATAIIPITLANAPTNLSAFCLFITKSGGLSLPTAAAGPDQPNVITFVDDFSNGVYRVTALVTNDPPIGNGVVLNLSYTVPPGATAGLYPLALPAGPPTNAPAGLNPEARSLATSDLIAGTGANGSIVIGTVTVPLLTAASLPGGAFQLGFTNVNGASFSVLATTNLTTPFSNWITIGAAVQVSSGQYQFTDNAATNYPRRFYSVHSP